MSKKVFKENPCPSCGAWDFSTNYTMDRFNKHFEEIVRYDILYKDRFTNVMQIPKINKIFVNTGIGKKAVLDNKHIFTALLAIELITGQKPIVTRAKKWVDKFQLKKNMPIGCKVTLRHKNMNQFLDRLINRVLPRIEDFMGHNSVGGGSFRGPNLRWLGGIAISDRCRWPPTVFKAMAAPEEWPPRHCLNGNRMKKGRRLRRLRRLWVPLHSE